MRTRRWKERDMPEGDVCKEMERIAEVILKPRLINAAGEYSKTKGNRINGERHKQLQRIAKHFVKERLMIIICTEHFFEAAQMGYPETGLQMETVVEHETGNSTAEAEQNAV
jgi:hypothetical protein